MTKWTKSLLLVSSIGIAVSTISNITTAVKKKTNEQDILDVLNSLDVVESNGGEEAYILVENNKENHKLLNAVGVPSKTINKYGDEETFCIFALALSEGYADIINSNGKLVCFDKAIEIEMDPQKSEQDIILYKNDGDYYVFLSDRNGSIIEEKLTVEKVKKLRSFFHKPSVK